MELDILAAGGEIGIDRFQKTARSFRREAGQREAGNDAIGFLKTVFFEIYIDFFSAVIDDDQARILDFFQLFGQIFFDLKTKKYAIPAHLLEYFFRDDSRSAAELHNAFGAVKINFLKHLVGENVGALND